MRPGGLLWFAAHEARLTWRDWRLLSGRGSGMIVAVALFFAALHAIAALVLRPAADLAHHADKEALITITGLMVLSWSLMLSQAVENVTRAFYTRGDLELVLSSPVAAWRLFAVRIVAMVFTLLAMALFLTAPFIDVMAWRQGARWLSVYPVMLALASVAVTLAIVVVVVMFRTIGPQRTRLIAQIVSAFVGAIFAVVLQVGAIQSFGTPDRMAFLQSPAMLAIAPEPDSPAWGLAYAAMGYPAALLTVFGMAALALAAAIAVFAPRFPRYVLAAGGVVRGRFVRGGAGLGGRALSPAQAMRRKEWALLRRDPWLVSQTLVQILYLLPAAYLLWRTVAFGVAPATLLVPVLITAAGQFSGGLAWLAISGEDAPDLVGTAPIRSAMIVRAKFEATMGGTLIVFAPFLLALLSLSPRTGLAATGGIVMAAASATAIQYWYRLQATRGRIRRRQTASRLTTYAEALASVSWAAAAALASAGTHLAFVPAIGGLLVVGSAWLLSPSR